MLPPPFLVRYSTLTVFSALYSNPVHKPDKTYIRSNPLQLPWYLPEPVKRHFPHLRKESAEAAYSIPFSALHPVYPGFSDTEHG